MIGRCGVDSEDGAHGVVKPVRWRQLLVGASRINFQVGECRHCIPAAVPMSRLVVPRRGPVPVVRVRVTILLAAGR